MLMRRALIPLLTAAVMALMIVAPGLARADSDVVRFQTSLGNIDVELLQSAPQTVANFLSYVNSGAYATTFMHRSTSLSSDSLAVIQGGGYDVVNGNVDQIPEQAPVDNEYGAANAVGTLAMAKVSNAPNSATNQWFFNVSDNSSTLGPDNDGGFTVFGRVLTQSGLNVMNAISALPTQDESSSFNCLCSELPYTGQSATIQTLVMSPVTVLSTTAAPTIAISQPRTGEELIQGQTATPQFTCTQGAGAPVHSCTAPAVLDTSSPGQHSFTVVAIDENGNTNTQTVQYGVIAPSSPASSPPTSKPKPTAPSLKGSLTTTSSGHLLIKLSCSTAARCTGRATLYTPGATKHSKRVELASARYSISAHRQGTLTLHLKRAAITRLRHAKGHLEVSLVLAPGGGKTRTLRTRLTLRRG